MAAVPLRGLQEQSGDGAVRAMKEEGNIHKPETISPGSLRERAQGSFLSSRCSLLWFHYYYMYANMGRLLHTGEVFIYIGAGSIF